MQDFASRDLVINPEQGARLDGVVRCSEAARSQVRLVLLGRTTEPRSLNLELRAPDFFGDLVIGIGRGQHHCDIASRGKLNADINFWRDSRVTIGPGTTINNARIIMDHARLEIGADNLWSDDILVQTNDQHGIHDLETGRRLGAGRRETLIGDHVWIGRRSLLMPALRIGQGSLIGAGSTVTQDVPPFCVSAGSPSRVLRENTSWSRNPERFSEAETAWLRAARGEG